MSHAVKRFMVNICSHDLLSSRDFYLQWFDFELDYESDWFVLLRSRQQSFELGIILADHEIVPREIGAVPQGAYLTFVVENVDVIFEEMKQDKHLMIHAPEDTFYGQRRMLVKDPNGIWLDISSPSIRAV